MTRHILTVAAALLLVSAVAAAGNTLDTKFCHVATEVSSAGATNQGNSPAGPFVVQWKGAAALLPDDAGTVVTCPLAMGIEKDDIRRGSGFAKPGGGLTDEMAQDALTTVSSGVELRDGDQVVLHGFGAYVVGTKKGDRIALVGFGRIGDFLDPDDDGDGVPTVARGGGDCDDADDHIYPGQARCSNPVAALASGHGTDVTGEIILAEGREMPTVATRHGPRVAAAAHHAHR